MHAQDIEIVSTDLKAPDMRILACMADPDRLNPVGDEPGKRAVPIPKIDVIGIRL